MYHIAIAADAELQRPRLHNAKYLRAYLSHADLTEAYLTAAHHDAVWRPSSGRPRL